MMDVFFSAFISICVLQTEVCGYTFQTRFGRPFGELGRSGWFRPMRQGEVSNNERENLKKAMEEMHNARRNDATRNDATRNGHLPLVSQLTAVASILKPTSLPGQINYSRQKNAKAFWESFLLRRRSEFLSILPIRHNEINQQMCRALPMPQRVHHDDCETLVLENNICFGKCRSPERNTNSEDGNHASCVHCAPVKLTKTVQLKCKNNTQVTKVVTALEDCHCELKKGLCSHSRQGPSLFDPILIENIP